MLALVGVLAASGAASSPEGLLLGAPTPATLAAVLGAVAALALLARSASAARDVVGLAMVPVLLFSGLRLPGLAAFSGPPLAALVLAGVVLILVRSRARVPAAVFAPALILLYGLAAWRVQHEVGAEGDEPHYLMVADSLLHDHDLALDHDYEDGRYRAFHHGPLAPDYRVRGREGRIYSLHAVGLSLLVLPAYAVGGYPAASFFMALLAVALALEIRGLLRDVLGPGGAADGAAWLVALCPPLLHYAGLVFTEIPAALLVVVVLRRGREAGTRTLPGLLGIGSAAAFLPWLNVRYGLVAVVLYAYAAASFAAGMRRNARALAALLGPGIVSLAALAAYHHALYGFYDPRRVYGATREFAVGTFAEGLPGLFFDQEFGLLAYAPLFVLAIPGLLRLARDHARLALAIVGLAAIVVLTAGAWPMWRGGFNPPARFLVPLVPGLALAVAVRLKRRVTAGAALLAGWSVWTGLAGAAAPHLVHRDRDGTAPLFRTFSGAEEWTRLLPAFVLSAADNPERRHAVAQAAVWAAALALAAFARRPSSARRIATASLAFVAAAGFASATSSARTGGRDAVRLVGRPALALPQWSLVARATGRWGPRDLDWGPLYEPHRHPAGAALASRLALAAGRYVLTIEGDEPPPARSAPELELQFELASPRSGSVPAPPAPIVFERTGGTLVAAFEVPETARAVTLLLRGGGPLLLRHLTLAVQPSAPTPV